MHMHTRIAPSSSRTDMNYGGGSKFDQEMIHDSLPLSLVASRASLPDALHIDFVN